MAPNNVGYFETEAIQRTLSNLQREGYFATMPELIWRQGSAIGRIIRPSNEIATKDNGGLNLQMITKNAFNARLNSNPMNNFKNGRTSKSDIIKLRFDYNNDSNNDFTGIDSTSTIPFFEMKGGAGAVANIVDIATRDVFDTINYLTSVMAHSNRDAVLAASDGGVLKGPMDGDHTYANSPTSAAGDTGGSFKIDSAYSPASFREGVPLDFYTAAGVLIISEAVVDGVNFEEGAVSFSLTSDSNLAIVDTLKTAFAAGAINIYIADTQNRGFKGGLAEVFQETYASGTDWYGGKDRSLGTNGHYIPQRSRVGAGSVLLQQSHLDKLAQTIMYRTSDTEATNPLFLTGTDAMRNLRADVGDSVIVESMSDNRSGDYTIGDMSVQYKFPGIGNIDLLPDRFARNDRAYFLYPEDLSMVFAEFRGPMVLSNTEGTGWDRRANSKLYDMQVTENKAVWWNRINKSGCVFNVK